MTGPAPAHGRGYVHATGHGEGGPASKRVIVGYGFWIFLLSDIVMFSAFFAAHAVLQTATAGGPSGRELFDPWSIAIADGVPAHLELHLRPVGRGDRGTQSAVDAGLRCWSRACSGWRSWCSRRGILPAWSTQAQAPQRSAFLSSFFALVGCHGLHVSAGLLWLGTMMAQVFVKGFRPDILRRLLCFNLFWHALDIIWVALFTIVYLIGLGR